MDRQSIDLKYISGQGIGSLVPLHRSCLYTTVYISSPTTDRSGPRPHRQKTSPDSQNANNPEWNQPIRLYFDSNNQITSSDLTLKFEIRTKVPLFADKLVGTVQVKITDLASDGPTGTLRHVTYQVVHPDEKTTNGVLRFSYILNESPVKSTESDTAPVQDSITLHHGSSYPNCSNNVELQEVYPPVNKPDSKPRFYPTLDFLDNAKPFVARSLLPEPNPQVNPPPPPMPESKHSLYPIVSTEPVIAYPVHDSGVNAYHQFSPSLPSYPQVEPVGAMPGYYYPPPQAPGYCYQMPGWDGRYL